MTRRLRIGTWNVEYADNPETNARRQAIMAAMPADIWVLTETHERLSPGPEFTTVHSAQRAPLGGRVSDGSRWTSIWSRYPMQTVDVDGADVERTVAARVETPIGSMLFYGTVMPWRGDTARDAFAAISRQAENWRWLRRRYPDDALCVAGDFNVDMLQAGSIIYPSAAARTALLSGLEECFLFTPTAPNASSGPQGKWLIDHIAIPKMWEPHSSVAAVWKEETGAPRLSDHWGVIVQIDLDSLPKAKRRPLQILVAGPYRSGTGDDPAKIKANVDAMTETALQLFRLGHLPAMGEWYALPLIEHAGGTHGDALFDEIFHPISRTLVAKCDACLRIGGPSAGADEMVALARQHGKAVYFSLAEIPPAT